MPKIVFSSDQLPAHLDDRTRFAQWYELYRTQYGGSDISVLPDRPFRAHTEFTLLHNVVLAQYEGTNAHITHTAQHIANMRAGALASLVITRTPVAVTQHRRELVLRPDGIGLFTNIEPAEFRPLSQPGVDNGWMTISMPTARLQELVARAEDLIAAPIDPVNPAIRHLQRYLAILREPDSIADDPSLTAHIETTLVDLVALALGSNRDATALAQMRGLRAARTLEVIAEIKASFADPACTPALIAQKLGISVRYLHELLRETGLTFGDRLIELRLQQARAMLAGTRYDRMKVSEIALACGFNEISNFNRLFRRRFGASPTQYRGG